MTPSERGSSSSGMMNGVPVGRIRGIAIRLNWSVAFVAALIAWSLADTVFPDLVEGRSSGAYWTAATVTTALFFASLVAHEVAHALVALRAGIGVRAITLWLFGGIAELERKPERSGDALRIAAAGPLASGAIGVAALGIGVSVGGGLTQASVMWLGAMNLLLMAFNLLPAFPLDGGRIYHAWLWGRSGDEVAATNTAARAGLATGAVLVGLGVIQLFLGGIVGGIWSMAIGWFIREAARSAWQSTLVEQPLAALTVADVMTPHPETVPADTTIDAFVAGLLRSGRHAAYPVVEEDGRVSGLVALTDVRRSLATASDATTVSELARPIADVPTTSPTTPLKGLLEQVSGHPTARALVFADHQLVGIVSPSDLARLLEVIEIDASRRP